MAENNIVLRPHITEKTQARQSARRPVFTFAVPRASNKAEIKKTIGKNYKVKPVKVRIINIPSKRKKVMIYLKPGEKIDLK